MATKYAPAMTAFGIAVGQRGLRILGLQGAALPFVVKNASRRMALVQASVNMDFVAMGMTSTVIHIVTLGVDLMVSRLRG